MASSSGVVLPLLDMLRQQIELLHEWREISYPDLVNNVERQHAIKHALLLAIQVMLDISAHIISVAEAGAPGGYREMPLTLARPGILPQNLAENLAGAAGFRNRLVHGSKDIVREVTYEFLYEDLGDFDRFATCIYDFLTRLEGAES